MENAIGVKKNLHTRPTLIEANWPSTLYGARQSLCHREESKASEVAWRLERPGFAGPKGAHSKHPFLLRTSKHQHLNSSCTDLPASRLLQGRPSLNTSRLQRHEIPVARPAVPGPIQPCELPCRIAFTPRPRPRPLRASATPKKMRATARGCSRSL